MTDRRRARRYVLGPSLHGDAMPMHDVTVEDRTGDRLIVIAPSAHRCDEELMVQMTTSIGTAMQTARVVSSRLVTVHGKMCFRVELRLNPASPALAGREAV